MKMKIPSIRIVLTIVFLAVLPKTHAVIPAPDGGYPGGNTAEGQAALFSRTTGGFNTAVGYLSLRSDTAGAFNTAVGAGTLLANTADQNTATGVGALLSNTVGFKNTGNGAFALFSNTEGSFNTANGANALQHNTTGSNNTAIGFGALVGNTTGSFNTAIGGDFPLLSNSGSSNTAIGDGALQGNTTGSFNTALGYGAGINVSTANNVICIGTAGNNVDNSCFIGQIFGATSANGVGVLVNSNGRLGTMTSSERFKRDIKPMEKTSEALFGLKPVTFRYKKEVDPAGTSQFGLVAEDVEQVNPDLVARDEEGKPYSVRYEQVNAMLLNEFLKEHRKVQRLEAALEAVNARFKEQDAKIQKVSDQLELSKPAPRVVSGDQR
jgi:Chaperone of endosialidase